MSSLHEMIDRVTRRRILQAGLTAVTGMTAGCEWVEVDDLAVPRRSLTIHGIGVEHTDSKVVVTVRIQLYAVGGNESFRRFHNVSIGGYDSQDEAICRKRLGDFNLNDDMVDRNREIELHCPEVPQTIRFTVEESPCDEDTHFEYFSYSEEQGGDHIFAQNDERCNKTDYSADR